MGNSVFLDVRFRDLTGSVLNTIESKTGAAFQKVNQLIGATQNKFNDLGRPVRVQMDTSDITRAGKEVDRLNSRVKSMKEPGSVTAGAGPNMGQLVSGSFYGNLAARGVEMGVGAIYNEGKSVVNAGMEGSQQKSQFEVMGGEKEGGKLFDDVTKYIQSSVFGNSLYADASTLMGFGDAVKDVLPDIKMLGDVSRGNAQRMSSLALVYGQTQAAGKLQGGDLLQYVGIGFNPLQEIARTTGKKYAVLRQEMEKGNITFDMVKHSFETATSQGGKFHGMLDKISKTPYGKMEAMKGNIESAKMQLGTAFLPVISRTMDAFKPMIDGLPAVMERIAPAANKLFDNFNDLVPVIEKFGKAAWDVIKPFGEVAISDELKTLTGNVIDLSAAILKTIKPVTSLAAPILEGVADIAGKELKQYKNALNFVFDHDQYSRDTDPRIKTSERKGYVWGTLPVGRTKVDSVQMKHVTDSLGANNIFPNEKALHAWDTGFMKKYYPKVDFQEHILPLPFKEQNSPTKAPVKRDGDLEAAIAKMGDSIIGGGQKMVTINVRSFVEKMDNHFSTAKEATSFYEYEFSEMLLRVLKSAAAAAY